MSRVKKKKFEQRFLIGVTASYTLLLTYLLLAPDPLWFLHGDEIRKFQVDDTIAPLIQHLVAYCGLSFLFCFLSKVHSELRPRTAVIFVLSHAVTTEGAQAFIPNRYSEWSDVFANFTGLCIGWLFFRISLSIKDFCAQEKTDSAYSTTLLLEDSGES